MSKNRVVRSGIILFAGILLSRALGIFRELALVGHLGTTSQADIAIALITLPDLLINIFIGNAIAVVLIPKLQQQTDDIKLKFFLKISFFFFLTCVCLLIPIWFNVDLLAALLLPAQKNSVLFWQELRWVIISFPFLALNSISRVFLQNEKKIGLMSIENALFNIAIIVGITQLTDNNSMRIISLAIITGSVLRWVYQALALLKFFPINFSKKISETILNTKDISTYGQALSSGLVIQLVPIFARSLCSYFSGDGALAIFNYVYKFSEFPLAVVFSVVSTILFPKLTASFIKKDASHYLVFKKIHNSIFSNLAPLCIIFSSILLTLSLNTSFLSHFKNEQLSTILQCGAIATFFLFIRALNEIYLVALNSINAVKNTLMSTIYPLPLSFFLIYLLGSHYGTFGVFVGLNCYYVFVFVMNVYYYSKLMKLDHGELFLNVFNKNKSILFFILVIALYAFSSHLSFLLYVIFCFLLLLYFFYNFVLELRENTKSV